MTSSHNVHSKRCIILSQGPVPVPEHTQVEGGGLRCWGLAKGIIANYPDIEITVAYHESYRKQQFTQAHEGINIATWNIDNVGGLIESYDTVLVSYCMGELSTLVADIIGPHQQLILDCYVPIYIEVSARESADIDSEYEVFEDDVIRWGKVLKRGDLFLCASEVQKNFYKGVLAAIGRFNPITYNVDLILVAPYGIYRDEPKAHEQPITRLLGKNKDCLKVLWFGGIYPWFDINDLAQAVKQVNAKLPSKLIVVGAKNPFNTHPDFIARYEKFIKYVSTPEMKQYVIVQDWIDFNNRADWYLDADLVVVFNKQGEENKLAWRTRLVDFMWADLPVLTNGGDPLGEAMISNNAAVRMSSTQPEAIAKDILSLLSKDRIKVNELRKNLRSLKEEYYWDMVTAALASAIRQGIRAQDLQQIGMARIEHSAPNTLTPSQRRGIAAKAKKMKEYIDVHGYRTTALAVREIVRRRLQAPVNSNIPKYVFVSHQLDLSGAVYVAIDMACEFKEAGKVVEFYTYGPVHKTNLSRLNKAGIKPHILMNKDMVPTFGLGDTVILNTVAHSELVKGALFVAAEQGNIKRLIWYLHEDNPEFLFRPDEQRRIKKMLAANQIELLTVAKQIKDNYIEYFGTSHNITVLLYRHVVPQKFHRVLTAHDFTKKLTFVLPGTITDGRKGQLPVFYAFVQFYDQYYKSNPKVYRDFELVLVGVSKEDFLSRQLIAHKQALKGHFSYHPTIPWEQCLDIISQANITICYSLREGLPLFVFEGMITGHPILRNDCSGMEEQLRPGKNGWYIKTNDFEQVVQTIESVLNKSRTSDAKLASMSKVSYGIAKKQATNSYLSRIESV